MTAWQILTVDGRWNVVGRVTFNAETGDYLIEQGQVIECWGTERGLAQLAEEGPTESTRLSMPATIEVHRDHVRLRLHTRAELWT